MKSIFTLVLFSPFLCGDFIKSKRVAVSVFSYLVQNNKDPKHFTCKHRRRAYTKKKTIHYEDGKKERHLKVVTQKDISNINTLVLALLEYKKIHENLVVPENYILKEGDNENLKNFKLWKKLQDIKNEKSEKKKKYIYFVLKKMDFPLNTIFSAEEIHNFEADEVEITTMSKLSTEENVHYDFDERQEVRKELFSPYVKKEKDLKGESVKDFLASYKFIPKISEQGILPEYTNKSVRKKGILKYILHNLKKEERFNSQYNYYYDNIYNNVNDNDVNDYFKYALKFGKSNETYDLFVNKEKSLQKEVNTKEKKFLLYTRKETEGAHSYDFDKWSFSDFVEALIFFNDLYLDLNKENYEKFKRDPDNEKLDIVDFNALSPGFVIPNDGVWPSEWYDMPLGMYITQVRMGDIDGKFHFIRRKILDYLSFDFKSDEYENKYVNFTWRKLYLGLAWLNDRGDTPTRSFLRIRCAHRNGRERGIEYSCACACPLVYTSPSPHLRLIRFIHTRGHPIIVTPFDKIQFDTFSMDFCKPEEIQVQKIKQNKIKKKKGNKINITSKLIGK